MGSIPNGSAPLQACARQIFKSMLPGHTGKAQVRLAAAGRLRSAVALELAAGKVWALPIAVQIQLVGSSGATARATLNGLGATACAPVPAFHHACGREELPRCWAKLERQTEGQLAEGHKPFLSFLHQRETKVESSPSRASTTRWFGTNERMRFSNGLQYFKKRAFVSAIPE